MKEETITLHTNRKKIIGKIVLFVVFSLIAVISFTYGIVSCSNQLKREAGLTKIEMGELTLPNQDVIVPYDNEISFYYYVDKDKKYSVDENYSRITRAYNAIAGRIYEMTDVTYEYDDIISLAYINHHPNQEIEISKELWAMLKDAYQKTKDSLGHYSIFSGRLAQFWKNSTIQNDPYNVSSQNDLLDAILKALSLDNESKFDLLFDANTTTNQYYVTFIVDLSESLLYYQNQLLIQLDFNQLKDAYTIDAIANYLLDHNFTKGYLTSQSGCYLHLQDYWLDEHYVDIGINIFAKTSKEDAYQKYNLGSVRYYGAVRYFTFSNYYSSLDDHSKYQIIIEDQNVRRHAVYDAVTGYPINSLRYIRAFSNNQSQNLVDLGYQCLVVCVENSESLLDKVKQTELSLLYLQDNGLYDDVIDDQFKINYQKITNLSISEAFKSYAKEIISTDLS